MSTRTFDRETLLDLSVNAIPLVIIVFFVVVYATIGTFPDDPVVLLVQMSILLLTAGGLALLTYVSGKAISTDEDELDTEELHAGYSRADVQRVEGGGDEPVPATDGEG